MGPKWNEAECGRPLRVAVISWCVEHKLAATAARGNDPGQAVAWVSLINHSDLYVSRSLSCAFYELRRSASF